jgi:uncharacterized membrane protein
VILYLLARRVSGERVALVAAGLLAVAPLDVWYAQEARMFAFATLAVLVAALGLSLQSWLGAALIAVGLTVGLYFYFAVIPLWLCLSAVWFAFRRGDSLDGRTIGLWLVGTGLAMVAFVPLWPRFATFMAGLGVASGISAFVDLTGVAVPGPLAATLLLVGAVAVAFLLTTAISRLLDSRWQRPVFVAAIATFLLLTAAMPIPRLYSLKRLTVIGWPYFVFVIAWVMVKRAWFRGFVVSVALLVSMLASLASLFLVRKSDYRGVVRYLDDAASPNDAVWMHAETQLMTYRFYRPRIPGDFGSPGDLLQPISGDQHVWLIATRCLSCITSPIERWLDAHGRLDKAVSFYELELRLYSVVGVELDDLQQLVDPGLHPVGRVADRSEQDPHLREVLAGMLRGAG